MKPLIKNNTSRENERLIGEDEAEYAKSCYRQLLAAFLGKHNTIYDCTEINLIDHCFNYY